MLQNAPALIERESCRPGHFVVDEIHTRIEYRLCNIMGALIDDLFR